MPAPDVVVNAADQLFASIERGDEAAQEQMFDATSRYGGSDHDATTQSPGAAGLHRD